MYRKLITAAFILGITALQADAQSCCNSNGATPVWANGCTTTGCYWLDTGTSSKETKPLTPREKLKVERDSYQRKLDGYIQVRDEYIKKIDETSAQLKGYDDAIEKLSK